MFIVFMDAHCPAHLNQPVQCYKVWKLFAGIQARKENLGIPCFGPLLNIAQSLEGDMPESVQFHSAISSFFAGLGSTGICTSNRFMKAGT